VDKMIFIIAPIILKQSEGGILIMFSFFVCMIILQYSAKHNLAILTHKLTLKAYHSKMLLTV
jgi:hypothetical protein